MGLSSSLQILDGWMDGLSQGLELDFMKCRKEAKQFVYISDAFQAEGENEVNNELANRISLFYADATPMLKTLSDGTTKFVSEVRLMRRSSERPQHVRTSSFLSPSFYRTRTCRLRTQQTV